MEAAVVAVVAEDIDVVGKDAVAESAASNPATRRKRKARMALGAEANSAAEWRSNRRN